RAQAFLAEIGIGGRAAAKTALAQLSPEMESSQADTVPTGELFWSTLRQATAGLSFETISAQSGVIVKSRRKERPLRRSTVASLALAFPDQRLAALGTGDVYWDEIVKIEPAGTAEVF